VLGVLRKAREAGVTVELARVNGQLGGVARDPAGRVLAVISLAVGPSGIEAIYNVFNPAKLRHLPPRPPLA
jgi:hypothetical protein